MNSFVYVAKYWSVRCPLIMGRAYYVIFHDGLHNRILNLITVSFHHQHQYQRNFVAKADYCARIPPPFEIK